MSNARMMKLMFISYGKVGKNLFFLFKVVFNTGKEKGSKRNVNGK